MWQSPQQANTVVLMDHVVSKPKECKLSKSKNGVISMAKCSNFQQLQLQLKKVHCKVLPSALNKVITQDL